MDTTNEPCEPCEAEEKERAAQQVYAHSYSSNAAQGSLLNTPPSMEASHENLLLAIKQGREMFSEALHKLNELEMFLDENDVPDTVVTALFQSYRHFLGW